MSLVGSPANFKKILSNKKLALLGDAIVNFIASAALSLQKGATGIKVSGKVLQSVYNLSILATLDIEGIDKGEAVEAFLAYAWLNNMFTCEDGVKVVYGSLKKGKNLDEALAGLIDKVFKEHLT
jgi:hypothetical protein